MRRCALRLDHPGDAVREHARLAGARAGEHQHRAHGRGDGGALRVVQRVENRGEVFIGARILGDIPHFRVTFWGRSRASRIARCCLDCTQLSASVYARHDGSPTQRRGSEANCI